MKPHYIILYAKIKLKTSRSQFALKPVLFTSDIQWQQVGEYIDFRLLHVRYFETDKFWASCQRLVTMGQSLRQVTQDWMISRMHNFSNLYSGDTYGNGNVKKRNRFYELHNYDDLKWPNF